jgi:hypothetical protein
LDQRNVPIELLVSFDATNPRPVPKNVLHVVNFFQQNGFGKQVTAAPDFKGQLSNVDLTAETGLSHTTIDKSPRLHAMVMRKIAGVVEQDLVKRVKASKRSRRKRKTRLPVPHNSVRADRSLRSSEFQAAGRLAIYLVTPATVLGRLTGQAASALLSH